MPKKLSPKDQLIWMVFSLPTGYGFGYFAALSAYQLGFRLGDNFMSASPTLGITAMFTAWGLYQLSQLGLWSGGSRSRVGVFASLVPAKSFDPDVQSWTMKYNGKPVEREFVFAGRGLTTPIPETVFSRFVKLAWRRQSNALYGSKMNMLYAGEGYRRLTVNQIFSEIYYTREVRPRFDAEDYYGCLHILAITKLLRGRRQGRGGVLAYPFEQVVEQAKALWYPSPTNKRTWSTFGRFLPIREVARS